NTYSDCNRNGYPDTDSYGNCYCYPDTDSNCNAYTNAYADRDTYYLCLPRNRGMEESFRYG
ncbi:MAG TPA: hypothetical protein P5245_09420, partial [Candidatus Sumerlaeia bacterium]|nr:hypothetical protein [Candidatus Sumerlaeia bacterium]